MFAFNVMRPGRAVARRDLVELIISGIMSIPVMSAFDAARPDLPLSWRDLVSKFCLHLFPWEFPALAMDLLARYRIAVPPCCAGAHQHGMKVSKTALPSCRGGAQWQAHVC